MQVFSTRFCCPTLAQVDNEISVGPYESEADKRAIKRAEEEKRRREEQARETNDKFRALEVLHTVWGRKNVDLESKSHKLWCWVISVF